MAIAIRIHAAPATREQFNALDDALGNWSAAHGGPPDGYMSYAAYADGEGFSLFLIWNNEAVWQRCWDDIMHPLFAEVGIPIRAMETSPLWGLLRK